MPCQALATAHAETLHDSEEFHLQLFGTTLEQLESRARQKAVTNAYLQAFQRLPHYQPELFPLVDPKKRSMYGMYESALECCNYAREVLVNDAVRYASSFCKKRFCVQCNRIRQSVNFKLYRSLFERELFFVTLTRRNVPESELETEITALSKLLSDINKNKFHRNGNKLIGLRKMEVTYNASRCDYHPHLHLLLTSEAQADALVCEWMNATKNENKVSRLAQDYRKADDDSKFELLKYTSKILTAEKSKAYVNALDVINRAMIGKRSLQPFGFKVTPEEEKATIEREFGKCYEWSETENNYVHYRHVEYVKTSRVKKETETHVWYETETEHKVKTFKEKLLPKSIPNPQIEFIYD